MQQLPTAEQTQWLKEYYRTFSRNYLAVKLGIGETLLGDWLNYLALKKKKDAKRLPELTDEQKLFVKDNYQSLTHEEIADKLGLPVAAIRKYCTEKKFRKWRTKAINSAPKRFATLIPEKKGMNRPPAIYDNPNWQDRINELLNLEL